MIGKVMKGRGFGGLARYLETGKTGTESERVGWIEARNLPTNDPQTVSLLMRATAAQSDRVQKPVYHLAISFDRGDPVDRTTMHRVADRVLSDLGVGEHQALLVAHRDTEHPHLHVMLNRVHPETGRAWDPKNDYLQIERSLRVQERELGFRQVPGHHYVLDGQARPDRSDSLSGGQQRQRMNGEIPFVDRVRAAAVRDLRDSRSWGELEERLRAHGLHLVPKGRGMIVTDGQTEAKLSSVDHGVSRGKLEARFGDYAKHRELVESFVASVELAQARRSERCAELTSGPKSEGGLMPESTAERAAVLPEVAGRVPTKPEVAPPESPGRSETARDAAEKERTRPGAQPREVVPGRQSRDAADVEVPVAERGGADRKSQPLDPAVQKLVEELRLYERARGTERHIRQAVAEVGSAQQEVHALRDAASRAEVRRSEFDRVLEKTYKNPGVARDVFVQAAAEHGAERARELMEKKPELYGDLAEQRRVLGLVRDGRAARESARAGANAGKEYLDARATAPTAKQMEAAEQRLAEATKNLRQLVAENKLPPVHALERSIGTQATALTPVQQEQLQRAIPAPSLGTVMIAARAVREQGNVMER